MNIFILLFHFLKGSVKLKIKGEFSERFFNILAANSIKFWNIEKSNGEFSFFIFRKDFLKLKKLRKKAGIKVKIISKHGFPVIIRRYRKRYGIIVGCLLFVVLLNVMSAHIWHIEIIGAKDTDTNEIINCLEKLGVGNGVKTNTLNTDYLKQKLILSFENLSWASLNIQGSVLNVNISEFDNEITQKNIPCNLIAKSDGIIVKMNIHSGKGVVNIGETVTKGQVLVSGIKNEKGINSFIVSEGEIFASVPDKITIEIPKTLSEKQYSDENLVRYAIDIMGAKIPLFLGEIKDKHDKNISCRNLTIFENKVPIKIYKQEVIYFEESFTEISYDTALTLATEKLKEILKNENAIDFEILNKTNTENKDNYTVTFDIRKTLDIANKDFFKIIGEN